MLFALVNASLSSEVVRGDPEPYTPIVRQFVRRRTAKGSDAAASLLVVNTPLEAVQRPPVTHAWPRALPRRGPRAGHRSGDQQARAGVSRVFLY